MAKETKKKYPTIGSLFSQDLDEHGSPNQLYFMFLRVASCADPSYRFRNKHKYREFDFPTRPFDYYQFHFPIRFLAVVGDEITVLLDNQPGEAIKSHWQRWLDVFAPAKFITIDEGLEDEIPISLWGPVESIPENKHYHEPNMHWWLQCKSVISRMGVPTPKEMSKENATFPCLLKIGHSSGGRGNRLAGNQLELDEIIKDITANEGWDVEYIIQDYLRGTVFNYHMYLSKDGRITWLGTHKGGYTGFLWTSCTMDWNEQEKLKNEAYEDLAIPIAKFLTKHGYSGLVNFEVISTEDGPYVLDINLRVCGSTTYLFIAPYMADIGFPISVNWALKRFSISEQKLLQRAEKINEEGKGRVIVVSARDHNEGCVADVAVFAKSMRDVHKMFQEITQLVCI